MILGLLLACGTPSPTDVAGPSVLELPPPPELPCPFEVAERRIVGGVPVPGPPALAPAEDHLTVRGVPRFLPGRIAQVAEDGDVVWIAARDAGVHRVEGERVTTFATRSPAIAVDARDGVAWAATEDGEVLRIADGGATRFEVDGTPDAIVAAEPGAWVRDLGGAWHAVGEPGERRELDDVPLEEPDPVVALFDGVVATSSGVRAIAGPSWHAAVPGIVALLPDEGGWRAVTAKEGTWRVADGVATRVEAPTAVDVVAAAPGSGSTALRLTADGVLLPTGRVAPTVGGGWSPARSMATHDGWIAIGYGLMGRLSLLGPAGEARVIALPGPLGAVGAPIPGSRLRWEDDGLWIPMPAHGLARLSSPDDGLPSPIPGVPGAWDVAPFGDGWLVALGDLGVGVLAGEAMVGRCPLPGRVVRVATGPGGIWAASTGVVTRLERKPIASRPEGGPR